MDKIASFCIDHNKLPKGMYVSRIDGDITTFDIRTRRPNIEPVMENAAIHTLEHLFATYVRNSPYSDSVIYFGPMGCRTGFYFLSRYLPTEKAIQLTRDALAFTVEYTGEIPGSTAAECGNYRDHDLEGAKKEASAMLGILKSWTSEQLTYPK